MMKNVLQFLLVMGLAFVVGSSPAQTNLLAGHNGDFQISDVSWPQDAIIYTDYTYNYGDNAYHFLQNGGADNHGSGKFLVTANANNANGNYWQCGGHPSGHSAEKFLAVNGFGGNLTHTNYLYTTGAPSSKKIIQYTLQVEPNMFYDFQFWATHLTAGTNSYLPLMDATVNFHVKCNSSTVHYGNNQTTWQPSPNSDGPNWEQSPVFRCLSNSSGQLKIALYDDCEWLADYGDDFGIDDATLTLAPYSVTAGSFTPTGCQGSFDPIPLLSHVTFEHPQGQPAMPAVLKIRKDSSSEWVGMGVEIETKQHGTMYIGTDSLVYYTPAPGFIGTDQFYYRVEKFGKYDSKKIYIQVLDAPSDFVVSGFPQDGRWCKGTPFQFSATCNDNNGPLWGDLIWQWTESIGQQWHELNFNNFPSSSSCHDYYVRCVAENACGVSYSDTLVLKICDEPVLTKTSITAPNTICEGGALPNDYLSQVDVSSWRNDVGVKGWQVKHGNGNWVDIGNANLAQGDKLRYHAQNYCGEVTTNEVTISVTAGPEFTQPTPTSFDVYYCVGEQLDLSSQTPPTYNSNNITITDHFWARSTDGGNTYTKINGNPTLDLTWDGNWICYRLLCACGAVNSDSPFILHVYGDPEYSESLEPFGDVFCAGETLSVNNLQAPACTGSPDLSTVWQISASSSQSGSYSTMTLPYTLARADNGKWVRLYAISSCGDSPSNAVQLSVNDKATLSAMNITAPAAICLGGALPTSFTNQVYVSNWNGEEGLAGWWIKHPGGDWVELTSETELQNGDQVRYQATNSCGTVSTNAVTLEVSDGPILQSTPPFAPYFCVGDVLEFPAAPEYNPNGLTVLPNSSYWAYSDEEGISYTPIDAAPVLDEEWNGRLIRYHLAYQCDGQIVYAYSPNPVALTVYGEPTMVAPDSIPVYLDTVCWGTMLSEVLPEGFLPCEDCHYDSYGWEISESPGSSEFIRIDPNDYPLPVTDNGCWVRFYVDGCGEPATSELMYLAVGDGPSLSPEVISNLPTEVCEGTSVGSLIAAGMLTEITVGNWNLFDEPFDPDDPSYERWEVNYNGQWIPLSNFELAYNGCLIRYVAHNRCGDSEVVAPNPIAVVEGPSFVAPTVELPFEDSYCVSDLLVLPQAPAYVDPYNNITAAYWASSFDGLYYSEIAVPDPVLTESWHGRYISYVLESDCGGKVIYSTPFQLYVVGTPEVLSAAVEPDTLCEGERLTRADVEVDWNNGTDEGSTWQYMDVTEPGHDFVDFNPLVDPLPSGTMMVRYQAMNGCYTPGASDVFMIEVTPLPHFIDNGPLELASYCEGAPLTLPATPQTEGYVEGEGVWQMSATTNQNGAYLDVTNDPLTMEDEGKWLKYSVIGCNGLPVSKYGEIHVMDLPHAEFEINDNLCRGQYLNPQVLSVSGNVEYVLWRYTDSQGNTVDFSPVNDPFMVLGDFYVSWVAVNSCNEDHPVYSSPKHVEVVQGPEFAPVSWPNTVSVCSGMSLSELLAAYNIAAPQLTDPSYEPVPQFLGWYLKHQDENNLPQFEPFNLTQVISERYQGYELCYAMKGDCSNDPIYSNSIGLEVKGRPVINTMSVSDHFCSGESFPPADFQVEIDDHHSAYSSHWQRFDGSSWTDIPGHSFTIDNEYDGVQVRYAISSSDCSFEASVSDPITLHVTGTPEIMSEIQPSVGVCADGMLVIAEPEVVWHNTMPETGVWQVCATENGNYGVGPFGADGVMFDMEHVARLFDGWYIRYHVEGCNDENNSNAARITVLESSDVHITGTSQAAVMNSFWPGVYYYYTDVEGSSLNWTLTPEIWPYQDTIINGKSCCQVIVNRKGQATLTASVGDGSCGTDSFVINASPFGVEENEALKMELYPNPARHTVRVVSEAIVSIAVYDMLGQQVKTIDGLGDDSVSFSVAELPEALYLVEVQTRKGNKTLLLSVM